MIRSILVFLFMPKLFLIQPANAVLPYPVFELPINDLAECEDYSADCFERRGLCRNEAFKEIMRSKCPKTCRICGEIIKDDYETIQVEHPVQRHFGAHTSRSLNPSAVKEWSKFLALNVDNDFDEMSPAHLMNVDAAVDELETADYEKSDEYLSDESIEHHASTILPPSAILQPPPSYPLPPSISDHQTVPSSFHRRRCLDHAPNCFYLKSLCQNKFYLPIMKKNCEQTCGFCKHKKISHGKTRWTGIGKRLSHSWHGQNENCKNRGLDCDDKINWCTHWRYWKFMRRICAASCGFCDVEGDLF